MFKRTKDIGGTSLKGNLNVKYETLVEVFGEPEKESVDNYKSDAAWYLETPLGVATIYNYKNGKNYLGDDGFEIKDITEWNIGGKNSQVVNLIETAIQSYLIGKGEN